MTVRNVSSIGGFGSWRSPLSAEDVAAGQVWLTDVQLDGEDILWIEGRAADDGRFAVVRLSPDHGASDVTGRATSVRTRVHEYGGAAYVGANGIVWYSDFVDGRLYEITGSAAATPRPITPAGEWRFACPVLDGPRRRLICVREDHTAATLAAHGEPINAIVSVSLDSGTVDVLADHHDFCMAPEISPDGTRMAWVAWNHPNMPWDATELWIGEFGPSGDLLGTRRVAGGPGESVVQPRWSRDGVLHFASDRSGWWNLMRLADLGSAPQPIACMEADLAGPDWWLGLSTYGFKPDGSILAVARAGGRDRLVNIDSRTHAVETLDVPFVAISYLKVGTRRAVFVAGSLAASEAIVGLDLASGALETLRDPDGSAADMAWTSVAEPVTYLSTGGRASHGFYYAPRNPDFVAPADTLPPMIVHVHGGPTSATSTALNGSIQYFTSRGLAVLDVDYAGSTGYGRPYRESLRGQWGVADVDDCTYGARAMVESGQADPSRLVISGPSAGGYTTLAALAFRDTFRAGVSYFGITDPETWDRDTHKFESRYTEGLIEPRRYHERSPVQFAERIERPVLVLQGLDDRVVTPGQAEQMVAALRENGVPCAYLTFEGEGHDFRRSSSIRRALEAELSFYGQVLGFHPADRLESVLANDPSSMGA